MPKTSAEAAHGLRLTLGGAPHTPHAVYSDAGDKLAGYFSPVWPTPVGGPGEIPLAAAQKHHDDPGIPLELVEIHPDQVEPLRAYWLGVRQQTLRNISDVAPYLGGQDLSRARDELADLTDTKEES